MIEPICTYCQTSHHPFPYGQCLAANADSLMDTAEVMVRLLGNTIRAHRKKLERELRTLKTTKGKHSGRPTNATTTFLRARI